MKSDRPAERRAPSDAPIDFLGTRCIVSSVEPLGDYAAPVEVLRGTLDLLILKCLWTVIVVHAHPPQ
jgi:hypothetical protein